MHSRTTYAAGSSGQMQGRVRGPSRRIHIYIRRGNERTAAPSLVGHVVWASVVREGLAKVFVRRPDERRVAHLRVADVQHQARDERRRDAADRVAAAVSGCTSRNANSADTHTFVVVMQIPLYVRCESTRDGDGVSERNVREELKRCAKIAGGPYLCQLHTAGKARGLRTTNSVQA